jgi:hypothetical protein
MQSNGQDGKLLARRGYPTFYRVGPITASLHISDQQRTLGQTRFDLVFPWEYLMNDERYGFQLSWPTSRE